VTFLPLPAKPRKKNIKGHTKVPSIFFFNKNIVESFDELPLAAALLSVNPVAHY
jgi:hypothetical protein